ncbi:MAG: DJ-1/PfpI family protein [Lentisphaeria bacterium]|nr:DJ-1/PfpI family protein [Lentisphaeria bacterium]
MDLQQVILVLAEGYEETEAIGTADVLKRIGFKVILAGLNSEIVTSSAGTRIVTDCLFKDADLDAAAGLILPGGLPGSTNLRDSDEVIRALQYMDQKGKITAAICAAPIVLERAGLTKNRTVTGYPGCDQGIEGLSFSGNRTECDGTVVTGKGPGVSFEFAAAVAKALGASDEKINAVMNGMFVLR